MKSFEDFRHLQLDEIRGGAQAPRKQPRVRDDIKQELDVMKDQRIADAGFDRDQYDRLAAKNIEIVGLDKLADTSHSDSQRRDLQAFLGGKQVGDYNADARPEVGADQQPPLGSPEQRNKEMAWRSAVDNRATGVDVDIKRSADGQAYGSVSGEVKPGGVGLKPLKNLNAGEIDIDDVLKAKNASPEDVAQAKNFDAQIKRLKDSGLSTDQVSQRMLPQLNAWRATRSAVRTGKGTVNNTDQESQKQFSANPNTQLKPAEAGEGDIGTVYDKEIQTGIAGLLSGNSYLSDDQRDILTKEVGALNRQMQAVRQSNNAESDEFMNLRRKLKDVVAQASKIAEKQREDALNQAFGDTEEKPDVKAVADKAASRLTEPAKQRAKSKTSPVKSEKKAKAKTQKDKKERPQRSTGGSGGASAASGASGVETGTPKRKSQKDFLALHRVEVVFNQIKQEISRLMKQKKSTKDKKEQQRLSQQISVLAQRLEDISEKKFKIQKIIDEMPQ